MGLWNPTSPKATAMTVLGTGQGMEVPSGGRNNVPQRQWYLQEVASVSTCLNDRFLMGEERQKEWRTGECGLLGSGLGDSAVTSPGVTLQHKRWSQPDSDLSSMPRQPPQTLGIWWVNSILSGDGRDCKQFFSTSFSCSLRIKYLWMWELDYKGIWVLKNWCF